jgi:cell division protein FtsQ
MNQLADQVQRPRWKRRGAAVGLVLLVAAPWWAPPVLRQLEFFNLRRVEVQGARYVDASDVVARLRVDTTFSLWSDLAPLEARLRQHQQIDRVRVWRRLPSTLVVTITEHDPVALVPTASGFRVLDAAGRQLPIDPSRTPADLPIVARRDSTLLRLLGELKLEHPALFARLSELRRVSREELSLDVVSGASRTITVRVMADINVARLSQISLVEQDLSRRRASVAELDLRFRDQVIARFQ